MRRSIVGWQLYIQWRDGSKVWQDRKDLKEYHPVETSEYAVDQEIYNEPEFNWWVKAVLKNRLRIISLVKKRNAQYLKKTHKFGIEVPNSVAKAYALNKKNVNTLWEDAFAKEMRGVRPAFEKLERG